MRKILALTLTAWFALTLTAWFAVANGGVLIRGGTPTQLGEYEAVGTIPGCTATAITNNLVLTAAHCVCPTDHNAVDCATNRTFTLHDVFPVNDPSTAIDESSTRTDVSISGTVRVHPEYGQRGWIREDLAVIELNQPINQVARVTPISVESPYNTPFARQALTLVGYGASGANCTGPASEKRKATIPASASRWAVISFEDQPAYACDGDSGGPLLNAAGRVVGVASWNDDHGDSHYRPTSFSYNWIFGIARPGWASFSWEKVEQQGINSHQPGSAWCSDGSFLIALDLDGDRSISPADAPVIGQVLCAKLTGAANNGWGTCSWEEVEKRGINSHQPVPAWCPNGSFITQIDLDQESGASANDSPVIGQVRCCTLAGGQYQQWGSSYWVGVQREGINSHGAGPPWCQNGAFITQFDLDGASNLSDYDAPVVGQAKCSRPRP